MIPLSKTTESSDADLSADREYCIGSGINVRSGERHGYAPSGQNRLFGIIGTLLIYGLMAIGLVVTVNHVVATPPAPSISVFDVQPPASPPEVPPAERVAPEQIEKEQAQPTPPKVQAIDRSMPTIIPLPAPQTVRTQSVPDPRPRQQEAAEATTTPAPPAPQVSNNAPDTWEGRILAQLNKHRRYPRIAQARRQQGVPYIRFVIDREGMVLSVRLERSSGVAHLDREAVALPKRAQPLPKPPDDRPGDTIELVAPVEFLLR